MAEDRMRNDDRDMNLGGAGQQKDDFGKQTPGRKSEQDDFATGQRSGGQKQNEPEHFEDNFGNTGKSGGQGGQGNSGYGQGGNR